MTALEIIFHILLWVINPIVAYLIARKYSPQTSTDAGDAPEFFLWMVVDFILTAVDAMVFLILKDILY